MITCLYWSVCEALSRLLSLHSLNASQTKQIHEATAFPFHHTSLLSSWPSSKQAPLQYSHRLCISTASLCLPIYLALRWFPSYISQGNHSLNPNEEGLVMVASKNGGKKEEKAHRQCMKKMNLCTVSRHHATHTLPCVSRGCRALNTLGLQHKRPHQVLLSPWDHRLRQV